MSLTAIAGADRATEDQAIDRVHRFGQQREVRGTFHQGYLETALTACTSSKGLRLPLPHSQLDRGQNEGAPGQEDGRRQCIPRRRAARRCLRRLRGDLCRRLGSRQTANLTRPARAAKNRCAETIVVVRRILHLLSSGKPAVPPTRQDGSCPPHALDPCA